MPTTIEMYEKTWTGALKTNEPGLRDLYSEPKAKVSIAR